LSGRAYAHEVEEIEVLETHISWVILTGPFAYKIKKPIQLEFLDFRTLAQRRHYCYEELKLNQLWAPELYLAVVQISGSVDRPLVDRAGEAIEYALKMRQFPQSMRLDNQLDAGLVNRADMCQLAATVAESHRTAPVLTEESPEAAVQRVVRPMLDNFLPVRSFFGSEMLQRIETWTRHEVGRLKEVLWQRQNDGWIRECHGDLHLRNLVRRPTGIVPFDCLEFSVELRTLDVISDISFLIMDLAARAHSDLAFTFLNRYLERTGDYQGMAVLDLYVVYHCMIRAKVAAIRAGECDAADLRTPELDDIKRYASVASAWIERSKPFLIAMYGMSGSGKTWLSDELLGRLPAIRIRSDIERRRQSGLSETDCSHSEVGAGLYTESARTEVYARLLELADSVLRTGHSVIIDASHLRAQDRSRVQALANTSDTPLVWLEATADRKELERRLEQRVVCETDASEANVSVLSFQMETAEPLSAAERRQSVTVATDAEPDVEQIIELIGAVVRKTQ